MKKCIVVVALLLMAGCSAGPQQAHKQKQDLSLDNETAKFSYALGLDIGHSLKRIGSRIDREAFEAGVADVLGGTPPKIDPKEATEVKRTVFKRQQEKLLAERKVQGEKNRKEGEAFLSANAKKPGVTVTASGLQYRVLKQGTGTKPKLTDRVKVNYRGTLIDDTEFDSSYKRGQPVTFPLNGVIRGWTEGVQLMPVGSKYRFFIPSDLAYGPRGVGKIGPNTTLIFDIELLAIQK